MIRVESNSNNLRDRYLVDFLVEWGSFAANVVMISKTSGSGIDVDGNNLCDHQW